MKREPSGACVPAARGWRSRFACALLVLAIHFGDPARLSAAIYYVDIAMGSDANTGLAPETPWKTLTKVNGRSFVAGDQVLFKRGSVWRGKQLIPPTSGAAGNPIVFAAYGDGDYPIITGTSLITGAWTAQAGGIFSTALSSVPTIVFADSVTLTKGTGSTTLGANQWFHTGGRLYVRLPADADPTSHVIEWDSTSLSAIFGASVIINSKQNITIRNLNIGIQWTGFLGRGVVIRGSANITVDSCIIRGDKDENAPGTYTQNSTNVQITNNDVSHALYGIHFNLINGPVTGLIGGNTIHDLDKGNASEWDGIKIQASAATDGNGIIIRGNDITRYNEDGVDLFYAQNVLLENNYIHDPINTKPNDNQSGIKCTVSGVVIRYNRIENIITSGNNRQGIIAFGDNSSVYYNIVNNVLDYGIVMETSSGNFVANNTILNSRVGIGLLGGVTGTIRNNILYGSFADLMMDSSSTSIIGGYNIFMTDSGPYRPGGGSYSGLALDFPRTDPLFAPASGGSVTAWNELLGEGVAEQQLNDGPFPLAWHTQNSSRLCAQGFKHGDTGTFRISKVAAGITRRSDAPPGNIWAEIWTNGPTNRPGILFTGAVSTPIDTMNLGDGTFLPEFVFPTPVTLDQGTPYHLVFNTDMPTNFHALNAAVNQNNSYGLADFPYVFSRGDGTSWFLYSVNDDLKFQIFTVIGDNIWRASLASQPTNVTFNGVTGIREPDLSNLDAFGEWYWDSGVLYVYSTGDPDITANITACSAGGCTGVFSLYSTSPAIDAAIDLGLTRDFYGTPVPTLAAPDIGATEYTPSANRVSGWQRYE